MVITPDVRRVDSDAGCWTLTTWRPDAADDLAWAVQRIWDFEGRTAAPRERVFPNGAVELIVQLDQPHSDVIGDRVIPSPATCITGVFTSAFIIQAPQSRSRVLGVRLNAPAAWALLGHPLDQIANLTADLGDLLGPTAARLADRCQDADSGVERIRRVVAWLRRHLPAQHLADSDDAIVRHVTGAIAASGGTARIGALREETGLTATRLNAAFRRQVGVTPKHYARIIRFDRALAMLRDAGAGLADIAVRCGYYDQPHMNADFRELAGLTPGEYLTANGYPGSVSVAETTA